MVKITGSKFDMYDENDTKAVTFRNCVAGILENGEVSSLGAISTITSLQGSSIPSMFPITAIACAGN